MSTNDDNDRRPLPRMRRMTPYTKAWERLAGEVAQMYCPPIHPCADCGGPVVKGYCCQRCGSANPHRGQS